MFLFDQLILNTDETKYGGRGELKSSQYVRRTCDKRCYLHYSNNFPSVWMFSFIFLLFACKCLSSWIV